jgi:hypothetical protein
MARCQYMITMREELVLQTLPAGESLWTRTTVMLIFTPSPSLLFIPEREPVHIHNSPAQVYDWSCEPAVSTPFLSPPMTRVHGQRDSQHINILRYDPPSWKFGARWKGGSCLRPKHAVPQEKGGAKKTGACGSSGTGRETNTLKVIVHVCS